MADIYEQLDELVDSDPIKLRDEAYALLARAEKAEAVIARARKAAEEMAATPPGYGKPPTARGAWARAGRVILAALDAKEAGESQ